MNYIDKPEYDFLRTDERLNKNIILLGLGGSKAYGTDIETSDTDIRGIATRRPDDILLGNDFETIVDENTDTTIYSFDKMLSLLSNCNPNTIEILGLRSSDYLYKNEIGNKLLENKEIFLSKKAIYTFGNYATAQLYRLRQKGLKALSAEEFGQHIAKTINNMNKHLSKSWDISNKEFKIYYDNGLKADINIKNCKAEKFSGILNEINNVIREYNKNSKRNKQAIEHNKIHKHAMHLLRLYIMGIDILEKGEIITYREKEHNLLMSIRNGEYNNGSEMTEDFWKILDEYEKKFENAAKNTKLPDEPDFEKINELKKYVNYNIIINK